MWTATLISVQRSESTQLYLLITVAKLRALALSRYTVYRHVFLRTALQSQGHLFSSSFNKTENCRDLWTTSQITCIILWHTITSCTQIPFTDSTVQQWAPYGHPKRRCRHNLHVQGAFVPRKCRGTHAWTVFPVAKGRTTGAEDDFIKPSHVYVLPSHSYVIGEIFFFWLTPCMRLFSLSPLTNVS